MPASALELPRLGMVFNKKDRLSYPFVDKSINTKMHLYPSKFVPLLPPILFNPLRCSITWILASQLWASDPGSLEFTNYVKK
jgi:hypothetical protein